MKNILKESLRGRTTKKNIYYALIYMTFIKVLIFKNWPHNLNFLIQALFIESSSANQAYRVSNHGTWPSVEYGEKIPIEG